MIRSRFAPSPTGSLHVGNARIAVLNWLLTRHLGGAFVLRIEDTDTDRTVTGSEEQIYHDLRWLGLTWDEGPGGGGRPSLGEYGPYRQSERLDRYRDMARRLAATRAVYPCYCSPQELSARRAAARERGAQPHYDGRCRTLTPDDIAAFEAAGRRPALRFRVPAEREVVFTDAIRGEIRVHTREIGDFIVLRPDGLPTYNFAVVVDDVQMEITHVIRGSGHLSNTPRQVLVFEALGKALPAFAHVPMVLGPDRQKLSKRHGARSVSDYRREGYHPDAVVNYLSLLSWSSASGEELLSRDRLIEEVSLERLGAADVVFDPAKLRWLSARHIERMALPDLAAAVAPFIDRGRFTLDATALTVALEAARTHLGTFAEVNEMLAAFFPPEGVTRQGQVTDDASRRVLMAATDLLASVDAWTQPHLEDAIRAVAGTTGTRGRALYTPLRRALTGDEHGPPFVAVLLVQGRSAVLERLSRAAAVEA